MGSLGDHDDEKSNLEFNNRSDFESTQPFETQPFGTPQRPLPAGDDFKDNVFDDASFLPSTLPFADTHPYEDELETQVMNFAGETQVLDDFDGFENLETQLFDEFDNEEVENTDGDESDKTEMLCDTDGLSDNDSVKMAGNSPVSKQEEKESEVDLHAMHYEQTRKAGVRMNFTSVRAAALRASGLAARSRVSNESNSQMCSLRSNESSKDHTSRENRINGAADTCAREAEDDQDAPEDDEQMKGVKNESKGRIGNSAVRKLFADGDKHAENEELDNNNRDDADDEFLGQGNEIAGLSYVDSQEPGDLSQANALDFVDRFLKSSELDVDKGINILGSTMKKSKPVSNIKGTQSLAKKSRLENIYGEAGIYEWDDNCEDEGGGEFFIRKKKTFFDNEGKGSVRRSSTSKLHSLRRTAKKAKITEIKKYLAKELDVSVNVDPLTEMKATGTANDVQDMLNVGPDTQMAAEAMGDLRLGLDVNNHQCKDTNRITKNNKELGKKHSLRKQSSSEDFTRMSKQRKITGTNLSKDLTASSSRQSKRKNEKHKHVDTSNSVSPLTRKDQAFTCTPVASRTRQGSRTRQSISGSSTSGILVGNLSIEKVRRSNQKLSDNGHGSTNHVSGQETVEKSREISDRSKDKPFTFLADPIVKRKLRSSLRASTCERNVSNEIGEKEVLDVAVESKVADGIKVLGELAGTDSISEVSPVDKSKLTVSTSTTPASCTSSAIAASPILMGDEYHKQSCRKNLSGSFLAREINSLVSSEPEPVLPMKVSRRRRDMASVRVLFSNHLNDDIIRQQKKILAKLGGTEASSISEATHFVADKFVRTSNMMKAIAFGKPVVTHLWLESCGQANCCIEEKNYILRDAKKENEFGFSLPASLARACQRPLLLGLRVYITPSTKPDKEVLSKLVKAVHGLPVERIGRSVLKEDKIPGDLLVVSCEEDYATCVPFLEKGVAVFSSELILNGMVTQKLEYERHRLFEDHVRKTRSTSWLNRDNNQNVPVAK